MKDTKMKEAYSMMVGKTIDRIIDGGEDSQIFVFTDGTYINIFNDFYGENGIRYQLLNSNFEHIKIFK